MNNLVQTEQIKNWNIFQSKLKKFEIYQAVWYFPDKFKDLFVQKESY